MADDVIIVTDAGLSVECFTIVEDSDRLERGDTAVYIINQHIAHKVEFRELVSDLGNIVNREQRLLYFFLYRRLNAHYTTSGIESGPTSAFLLAACFLTIQLH